MAIIDHLAGRLSDLTGSEFEVKRVKCKVPYTDTEVLRYGIGVKRDGMAMQIPTGVRPMKQNDALSLLCGLCDLIEFGFIRVEKRENL